MLEPDKKAGVFAQTDPEWSFKNAALRNDALANPDANYWHGVSTILEIEAHEAPSLLLRLAQSTSEKWSTLSG